MALYFLLHANLPFAFNKDIQVQHFHMECGSYQFSRQRCSICGGLVNFCIALSSIVHLQERRLCDQRTHRMPDSVKRPAILPGCKVAGCFVGLQAIAETQQHSSYELHCHKDGPGWP